MRYELAFKYSVGRPGGWNNVLLLGVFSLIPVIGNIVLLGYLAEVAERLLRDPEFKDYPDFSFDRFKEYLQRGLWPFLVQLIVGAVLSVAIGIVGGIVIAIAMAVDLTTLGAIFVVMMSLAVGVASGVILWPATLQTQLAKQLDFDGLKAFVPDFWKVLGLKAYLSVVLYSLIASGITLIGLLCCFVGVIPASALVQMAAEHLMVQHYRNYLDAGGTPVGNAVRDHKPVESIEPDAMSLPPDGSAPLDLD